MAIASPSDTERRWGLPDTGGGQRGRLYSSVEPYRLAALRQGPPSLGSLTDSGKCSQAGSSGKGLTGEELRDSIEPLSCLLFSPSLPSLQQTHTQEKQLPQPLLLGTVAWPHREPCQPPVASWVGPAWQWTGAYCPGCTCRRSPAQLEDWFW